MMSKQSWYFTFLTRPIPLSFVIMMSYVSLLRGFYASYNKVQEHLLNQSIYVSCMCQVIVLEYPVIRDLSHITLQWKFEENKLLHHLKWAKRLFDCWCYVPLSRNHKTLRSCVAPSGGSGMEVEHPSWVCFGSGVHFFSLQLTKLV